MRIAEAIMNTITEIRRLAFVPKRFLNTVNTQIPIKVENKIGNPIIQYKSKNQPNCGKSQGIRASERKIVIKVDIKNVMMMLNRITPKMISTFFCREVMFNLLSGSILRFSKCQ